jgi:hypothetical protein
MNTPDIHHAATATVTACLQVDRRRLKFMLAFVRESTCAHCECFNRVASSVDRDVD